MTNIVYPQMYYSSTTTNDFVDFTTTTNIPFRYFEHLRPTQSKEYRWHKRVERMLSVEDKPSFFKRFLNNLLLKR